MGVREMSQDIEKSVNLLVKKVYLTVVNEKWGWKTEEVENLLKLEEGNLGEVKKNLEEEDDDVEENNEEKKRKGRRSRKRRREEKKRKGK